MVPAGGLQAPAALDQAVRVCLVATVCGEGGFSRTFFPPTFCFLVSFLSFL